MRTIDLSSYDSGLKKEDTTPLMIEVRDSLINVLFQEQVGAVELLKLDKLAGKIEKAGDTVMLEEAEYETVLKAVKAAKFPRVFATFVRRVLNAIEFDAQPS